MSSPAVPSRFSLLTDQDVYLFNEGTHHKLYEKLGAHPRLEGEEGTYFAVWAPNAREVSVIGDFNAWSPQAHVLSSRARSGIWEGFIRAVGPGALYKYHVVSRDGRSADKADPFAFRTEPPPGTASVVEKLEHRWTDRDWVASRGDRQRLDRPMTVYEVHLGSWRRVPEEGGRFLTYRESAEALAAYVEEMGFTHVELLPVMEHPFYGSWGYQTTSYFAPTSRYGPPSELQLFVDRLHRQGIGVILDWVPSHFPNDAHGLALFDGTPLYEPADPQRRVHPDWNSNLFDYARPEVRSFLLSSAHFWLQVYHADGLRVDAVSTMLYLDFGRKPGAWTPNRKGGRENLEAIDFLRRLNQDVHQTCPGAQMIAEESTAWPMVSRPVESGGLGFDLKWDLGWMNDTLWYVSRPPPERKSFHGKLTFRHLYAFTENFILPLSHDEAVYGKRSLLEKMPGDEWQKFANLRLLFGWLYAQPGKKLAFMGGELGQRREWSHEHSLDWDLKVDPLHSGHARWVGDLNRIYRGEPALYELDCHPDGFEWIHADDAERSVLTFLRKGRSPRDVLLVAMNFAPTPQHNYRVGVPRRGIWNEILNSDAQIYGGSGQGNLGGAEAAPIPFHGRPWSVNLVLPPLGAVLLKGPSGTS